MRFASKQKLLKRVWSKPSSIRVPPLPIEHIHIQNLFIEISVSPQAVIPVSVLQLYFISKGPQVLIANMTRAERGRLFPEQHYSSAFFLLSFPRHQPHCLYYYCNHNNEGPLTLRMHSFEQKHNLLQSSYCDQTLSELQSLHKLNCAFIIGTVTTKV